MTKFTYDHKRDSMHYEIDGFRPSWAWATGGPDGVDFWETDLTTNDGMEFHFVLPYTKSADVFETMLSCEWKTVFPG